MRQSSNGSTGAFARRLVTRFKTMASLTLLLALSWASVASAVEALPSVKWVAAV